MQKSTATRLCSFIYTKNREKPAAILLDAETSESKIQPLEKSWDKLAGLPKKEKS